MAQLTLKDHLDRLLAGEYDDGPSNDPQARAALRDQLRRLPAAEHYFDELTRFIEDGLANQVATEPDLLILNEYAAAIRKALSRLDGTARWLRVRRLQEDSQRRNGRMAAPTKRRLVGP